jgi:hypothetical protein
VHTAEHDEVGFRMAAHLLRQLVGIAGVVGELDDFVALVVVAENDDAGAKRRAGRGDARVHLLVGEAEIALGKRLPLRDVLLLVLRQNRYQRRQNTVLPDYNTHGVGGIPTVNLVIWSSGH